MNEFKQAIPLLMLLGIYFLVRYFGGATLGKKRVYRTYEDVLIDKDTNEVFIVVKNRILFFDRNRTYRLKYIRARYEGIYGQYFERHFMAFKGNN